MFICPFFSLWHIATGIPANPPRCRSLIRCAVAFVDGQPRRERSPISTSRTRSRSNPSGWLPHRRPSPRLAHELASGTGGAPGNSMAAAWTGSSEHFHFSCGAGISTFPLERLLGYRSPPRLNRLDLLSDAWAASFVPVGPPLASSRRCGVHAASPAPMLWSRPPAPPANTSP